MEKLFYGLTPEQKAEAAERLADLKYDGSLSDFFIQDLRKNVINVRKNIIAKKWVAPNMMGLEIPITEEFAKIEVKHDAKYQFPGEKGVIIVTTAMYKGVEDWYRLQKHLQKEIGIIKANFSSFEEFFQQYVDEQVQQMELVNYEKSLDEEKPVKEESPQTV